MAMYFVMIVIALLTGLIVLLRSYKMEGLNSEDWKQVLSKIKRMNSEQFNHLKDSLIPSEYLKRLGLK